MTSETKAAIHHHQEAAESIQPAVNPVVAGLVRLPRSVKIVGGAAAALGTLLALGVPLASLTPLIALGGCLGMHLFMGHGLMDHGGHDGASHGSTESGGQAQSEEGRR